MFATTAPCSPRRPHDAKIFKEIRFQDDIEAMQRDLRRLENWSEKWLLDFNADKCATMHIGHRNPQVSYDLNSKQLKVSDVEKDLGVYVSADLKPAHHVNVAAAKGNQMVGLIKRNFSEIDLGTRAKPKIFLVGGHRDYFFLVGHCKIIIIVITITIIIMMIIIILIHIMYQNNRFVCILLCRL